MEEETAESPVVEKLPLSHFQNPVHSGYLEKEGFQWSSWNTRYFVLDNRRLYYFKSDKPTETIQGIINLDDVSCYVDENYKKKPFVLKITHPDRRTFVLSHKVEAELRGWQQALEKHLPKAAKVRPKSMRFSRVASVDKVSQRVRVPLMHGYLYQKNWDSKGFDRRYFVLRRNVLFYYTSHEAIREPRGVVPLDRCSVGRVDFAVDAQFESRTIAIYHPARRTFVLAFDTEAALTEWLAVLQAAMTDASPDAVPSVPTPPVPSDAVDLSASGNGAGPSSAPAVRPALLITKKESASTIKNEHLNFTASLGHVQRKGYLTARLPDTVDWRRKWFVLKDNVLYQSNLETDFMPENAYELEDYVVTGQDDVLKTKFSFELYHAFSTTLVARADSEADFDGWLKALNSGIELANRLSVSSLSSAGGGSNGSSGKSEAAQEASGATADPGVRLPILQGELFKRGWKSNSWQKRFFVLRQNVLFFYASKYDLDSAPQGVIPLEAARLEPSIDYIDAQADGAPTPHLFAVDHPQRRTFVLAAETEDAMFEWVEACSAAAGGVGAVSFPSEQELPPAEKAKQRRLNRKQCLKSGVHIRWAETFPTAAYRGSLVYRPRAASSASSSEFFRKGFALLSKNVLFLSASENDEEPATALELDGYRVQMVDAAKNLFDVWHWHAPSLSLCTQTSEDAANWILAVQAAINELARQRADAPSRRDETASSSPPAKGSDKARRRKQQAANGEDRTTGKAAAEVEKPMPAPSAPPLPSSSPAPSAPPPPSPSAPAFDKTLGTDGERSNPVFADEDDVDLEVEVQQQQQRLHTHDRHLRPMEVENNEHSSEELERPGDELTSQSQRL